MKATAKTRVLFVDDEPLILELLEFTVAAMKGNWETRYADCGEKALQMLAREPFDLVVSDMRMPGMNGAQLLNEVMQRYPATSRIILSGYADREEILRCVGVTHQFLAKPCEIKRVESMLHRIQGLRERINSQEIQQIVTKKNSLPSIPRVYFELLKVLQNPNCSTQDIGEVVACDPGLTARVLQMVNSAFFGFSVQVTSASEAVMLLGVGTIRSLALMSQLFTVFDAVETESWSVESMWRHSIRTAQWARRIAELENRDNAWAEQAFTAGVLHDVGKLILLDNLAMDYLDLIEHATKERISLLDLERDVLGTTHADVGAYLLDLWGLPAPLVEATALHHEPSRTPELEFSPLTAVHVANALEQAENGDSPDTEPAGLDPLYLDQLSLGSKISDWRDKLRSEAVE
jgi:HD-like signal output (HDOD) protein